MGPVRYCRDLVIYTCMTVVIVKTFELVDFLPLILSDSTSRKLQDCKKVNNFWFPKITLIDICVVNILYYRENIT